MRGIFRPRRRSRAAPTGLAIATCAILGIASAVSSTTRPDVEARFLEADLDADGVVTRDELAALDPSLLTSFDVVDDNRDGRLSMIEFASLFG
jgi:Ca2+-binding EF-hand superfamily protein